jgi:hypothetical protein
MNWMAEQVWACAPCIFRHPFDTQIEALNRGRRPRVDDAHLGRNSKMKMDPRLREDDERSSRSVAHEALRQAEGQCCLHCSHPVAPVYPVKCFSSAWS